MYSCLINFDMITDQYYYYEMNSWAFVFSLDLVKSVSIPTHIYSIIVQTFFLHDYFNSASVML